jgi:hypothetical protein
MSNGQVLRDDNQVPVNPLYDATGHQAVNWQASTVSTDTTTNQKYAVANVNTSQIGGVAAQLDTNNYQYLTLGTRIAGEDIPNDVLKTEVRGTYTIISTNTTTVVKNAPGELYSISIGDPGSTWVLTCYDNTSASGTPFIIKPTVHGAIPYNITLTTGLTIVTTGTTAGNVVVSAR